MIKLQDIFTSKNLAFKLNHSFKDEKLLSF